MPAQVQNGSASDAEVRQQVERILRSPEFGGSEVLRNLLSFLPEHSLNKPGESVKEYELAVAALGRPAGFDPRLDSAVRVHSTRLRAKSPKMRVASSTATLPMLTAPRPMPVCVRAHFAA